MNSSINIWRDSKFLKDDIFCLILNISAMFSKYIQLFDTIFAYRLIFLSTDVSPRVHNTKSKLKLNYTEKLFHIIFLDYHYTFYLINYLIFLGRDALGSSPRPSYFIKNRPAPRPKHPASEPWLQ